MGQSSNNRLAHQLFVTSHSHAMAQRSGASAPKWASTTHGKPFKAKHTKFKKVAPDPPSPPPTSHGPSDKSFSSFSSSSSLSSSSQSSSSKGPSLRRHSGDVWMQRDDPSPSHRIESPLTSPPPPSSIRMKPPYVNSNDKYSANHPPELPPIKSEPNKVVKNTTVQVGHPAHLHCVVNSNGDRMVRTLWHHHRTLNLCSRTGFVDSVT